MAGYFRGSRRTAGMAGDGAGDLLGGRVRDGDDFVDLYVAGQVVGAEGVWGGGEGEEQARDAGRSEGREEGYVAGDVVGAGGVCGRGEGEEQARDACRDEGRDQESVAGEVTHWASPCRTIPCARGRWVVRACGGWGCGRAWSLRGGPRW